MTADSLRSEWSKRLVHQGRTEIASADSDVDDVREGSATRTGHDTSADAFGQVLHPTQSRSNLGNDVDTIDDETLILGTTESQVSNGPPFRRVDRGSCPHLLPLAGHITFSGQVHQRVEYVCIHHLTRGVDQEIPYLEDTSEVDSSSGGSGSSQREEALPLRSRLQVVHGSHDSGQVRVAIAANCRLTGL